MPVPNPGERNQRSVVGTGSSASERTCSPLKENTMASPATFRTPYDIRVELVTHTIETHSTLDAAAAGELALQILGALNSIPEKVR